jgi:anhydro-N-acetylmuramic acid kinase
MDLYVGLMSGTSMDAVDAVLVDFAARPMRIVATVSAPLPPPLRAELLSLSHGEGADELHRLGQADVQVGELFADAVAHLLSRAGARPRQVRAIGSHGQTIRHAPTGPAPYTLQIGDPNVLAERTGITTVADFRRRDIAAGGQGAPLVPAFHENFFRHPSERRAILNIGGMANLTLLPAGAGGVVLGFDTGPGNVLMDAWAAKHLGEPLDRGGAWARSGAVDEVLLGAMLDDPYFRRPPPKSTGRDHFSPAWLQRHLEGRRVAPADVQATLCQLTARSIVQALQPPPERVIVCGGGAHNLTLMDWVQGMLPGVAVEPSGAYGLDPDWVEAVAFAWLAKQTLEGRAGNVASVTGARGPVVGGRISRGAGRRTELSS